MGTSGSGARQNWRSQLGFTLPEVLATIAIMGILLGIAMSMWNNVIESRRVDSAANQMTSDMRLAHTRATNQLTDWRVIYRVGEPRYHLVRLSEVCSETPPCLDPRATEVISRDLPERTAVVSSSNGADPSGAGAERFVIDDAAGTLLPASVNEPGVTSTVEFNSDGGSYAAAGPSAGLKVGSIANPSRCWKITVTAATSRVKSAKEDGCG